MEPHAQLSRLLSWASRALNAWRLKRRGVELPLATSAADLTRAATAARPSLVSSSSARRVRDYALECMLPESRSSLDMMDLLKDYRGWCEAKGWIALELGRFADDMRDVCTKPNIAIETKGKRVLVRGVRFAATKVAANSA